MSWNEIGIAAIGLGLGYYCVALVMGGKKKSSGAQSSVGDERDSGPAQSEDDRSRAPDDGVQPWHLVLGVAPDAAPEQVKEAYRHLMGQYHPDKVASLGMELRELAELKSKEITTAYRRAVSEMGSDK